MLAARRHNQYSGRDVATGELARSGSHYCHHMGHWWELRIDKSVILRGKYVPPGETISFFDMADLIYDRDRHRQMDDENADLGPHELGLLRPDIVRYEVASRVVIERLNVMGFSYKTAVHEYAENKLSGAGDKEEVEEWIKENIPLLRASVIDYLDAETHDYNETFFGFDWEGGIDARALLALALDCANEESMVIFDLTDVLIGEYTDDLDWAEYARERIRVRASRDSPTIVLTEGKFDSRVIRASLELLRPHVASYFSFLEFDVVKIPGGVDRVGDAVRRFSAAGVANRIIAVLDNDTAGRAEQARLLSLKLPETVRVIRLPDVEYGLSYPTVNEGRVAYTDINGAACSLEFCFGEQVLFDSQHERVPVYLRGYDVQLKSYQGSLGKGGQKGDVQKNIWTIIYACQQLESNIAALRALPIATLIDGIVAPFD